MKWFKKKRKDYITLTNDKGEVISNDEKSGDYTPFFNIKGNLYSKPLTKEEMIERGYTQMEYRSDRETGYYAWICN